MAKGPKYRVPYRRRREAKTDYKARRILATSERPRFVIRPSNKAITIQVVQSRVEGDSILTQVSSGELRKYGWLGGSKNTSAAYLLGLIAGKKAQKKGIEEANLDLGLLSPTKGSRIFASVKGALDAGLEIPCDGDMIPGPNRIRGERMSEYAESLINPQDYERKFSGYLKRGLRPQSLPGHFDTVKMKIEEEGQ